MGPPLPLSLRFHSFDSFSFFAQNQLNNKKDVLEHTKKTIFSGVAGTGKTSLMQRYVNDVFDQAVSTTIGAGFANKRVYLHPIHLPSLWCLLTCLAMTHSRVINNVKIKLHIWVRMDASSRMPSIVVTPTNPACFAIRAGHGRAGAVSVRKTCLFGNESGLRWCRSMAPMYYRGATAAILVYDITNQKTFQAIQGWVQGTAYSVEEPFGRCTLLSLLTEEAKSCEKQL